jgi:hypothetical protein
MPLALSDEQMSTVLNAAAPLLPPDRDAFLRALANVLRGEPQPLGDGTVHRAIKGLQREFWRPPAITKEAVHHHRRVGPAIE